MEEGVKGAATAAATVPPTEQQVPLSRLNEVVGQRNNANEELKTALRTVQTLTQMIQQQRAPRPQAQEHPMLKKMREEGRVEEAAFMQSLMTSNQRLTASQAAIIEDMDRTHILNKYGKKVQPRLPEIEQMVENQRRNGNFQYSRQQAFEALLAQDLLQKEEGANATPPQAAAPAAAQKTVVEDDAPPSDPTHVTSLRPGGVSEAWDEKTRDAEFAKLKDFEF